MITKYLKTNFSVQVTMLPSPFECDKAEHVQCQPPDAADLQTCRVQTPDSRLHPALSLVNARVWSDLTGRKHVEKVLASDSRTSK